MAIDITHNENKQQRKIYSLKANEQTQEIWLEMRLGNKKFTDSRWLSEKERKVVYKLPQSALCFNEYAI